MDFKVGDIVEIIDLKRHGWRVLGVIEKTTPLAGIDTHSVRTLAGLLCSRQNFELAKPEEDDRLNVWRDDMILLGRQHPDLDVAAKLLKTKRAAGA